MSATSLFIPFVFSNFDQKYVTKAFSKIGNIERVDFVAKQARDGKTGNAVYIHFKEWYNNQKAKKIYETCIIKKEKYEEFDHDNSGYFWILLPNIAKKHMPGERKTRIGLGDANAINVKSVEKQVNMETNKHVPFSFDENEDPLEYIDEESLDLLLDPIGEWKQSEIAEIEAKMEEDINRMEREDQYLVKIDWRYVQVIEQENKYLHGEIAQLRMALINMDRMYQAEAAKVRAFSSVGSYADL